jgi:hypothetical protein
VLKIKCHGAYEFGSPLQIMAHYSLLSPGV